MSARAIRILCGLLLGLLSQPAAWAAGACSPHIGKVTLNEYNYIDNFTEVKKLDSAADLTGWRVTVYTNQRTTQKNLPSTGSNACFGNVYQTSTYASNEIGTNADVVLTDANGDVVDILRVRTSLPVSATYYGPKPACSFVGTTTDLAVTSGSKGVDRFADGNGDWRQTPGTGNNSLQSPCGPNLSSGSADLVLGKTVDQSSVARGGTVTFTLTVSNAGTGPASGVLVSDLLPAGLSYGAHVASVGTYTPGDGVWTVGNMVAGATATLTIQAVTTTAGTITNTATATSSTFDPNTGNNTAAVSVTVTSPGATLEAVEVGGAPGSAINTKLAGVSFPMDVLALAADGTIATTYNRTVTLELVDAGSAATCAAMTLLQAAGTYTFTGSGGGRDNGRYTFTFNYPNAARNVRIRMRDNSPTPITACSIDNFAIRPLDFSITSSANAHAPGTSTTATPVVTAGAAFTLSAAAVNGAGVTLGGYGGTPVINADLVSAHAGSRATGALSGTFAAAVSGVASGAGFTYGEVGYFRFGVLGVYDDSYTLVDQPNGCTSDYSNVLVAGKYGCKFGNTVPSGYVGRFVPASFETTVTQACVPGDYTYSGQPFSLTITARNLAGAVTQNYDGLVAPAFARPVGWSDAGATGLGAFSPATASAGAFNRGVATLTSAFVYSSRQTAPASIVVRAAESPGGDGVSSATPASPQEGSVRVRSGRVQLLNAYGSERLDLPMTLRAEYWTAQGWVRNTSDTCTGNTALGAANAVGVALSNPSPATLASCVLDSGSPGLSGAGCSAAGAVARQFRSGATLQQGDFNLWLRSTGVTGYVTVTANVPAWLEFNWTGSSADPVARATFGAYRSPLIYRRENY